MKIILLKDVPKVGHKYDLKEVADGFARNVLLPKKLAQIATASAVANLEKQKTKEAEQIAANVARLEQQLERLKDDSFTITVRANPEGNLFAAIKKAEILKLLDEQGFNFAEEHIRLEKPIKTVGKHEIEVAVGNKKGTIVLEVKVT